MTTADGTDDRLIRLEGHERKYTSVDVELTPELLDDVLSIVPAPADEEYPPG